MLCRSYRVLFVDQYRWNHENTGRDTVFDNTKCIGVFLPNFKVFVNVVKQCLKDVRAKIF